MCKKIKIREPPPPPPPPPYFRRKFGKKNQKKGGVYYLQEIDTPLGQLSTMINAFCKLGQIHINFSKRMTFRSGLEGQSYRN